MVTILQVLSTDDSRTWLVVTFYRGFTLVAVARPGDASWTLIKWEDPEIFDDPGYKLRFNIFMEVTYCKKMKSLVFIDAFADLFYCDIHNTKQPLDFKEYLEGPMTLPVIDVSTSTYVAHSNTELLIIVRYQSRKQPDGKYYDNGCLSRTEMFKVYRYNSLTKSWDEMQDLSNLSLFVGGNETVCVEASNVGCRKNCIYFCDENRDAYRNNEAKVGGHDLGVFDLSNKTIEPIYSGSNSKSSYCGPFWFSPAN